MARVSNHLASWGVSAALHILLFVLASPSGGRSEGVGIRQYEVGLVEVFETGRTPNTAAIQHQPEVLKGGLQPVPTLPFRPQTSETSVHDKPAGPRNEAPELPKKELPAKEPGSPNAEATEKGKGGGSTIMGSGEQFVISRPIYYPKNVQNEGVSGRVKVVLFLSTDGSVQASILESSGDDRLDRYSIRAVTEAWKYARPNSSVRILISLVFSGDRADVIFEGTEIWDGEET